MALLLFGLYVLLYTLFFKPRAGYLNCGLFGGSFNRAIDLDIIRKLKVLGMFNQQRGEHSCGYFNGDELVKGVDKDKKWFDFVVNVGVKPNEGKNNVFIGHVRHATFGSHTEGNAHPFDVQDSLILAHNGTLQNHWTLCNKYDVDSTKIFVDSLALGELIHKVGFKVLEEYKGAAALLMHFKQEPGTLYIYHGASRDYKYEVNPTEERPLFYMKAKEGVYVSSLIEPLKFIREDGDEPPALVPHNKIIPITKGRIKPIKMLIDREDTNIKTVTSYPAHSAYGRTDPDDYADLRSRSVDHSRTVPYTNSAIRKNAADAINNRKVYNIESKGFNIEEEIFPKKAKEDNFRGIFFRANRYYKYDNTKCHGMLILDKAGNIHDTYALTSISTSRPRPFYFWEGILLDSLKSWQELNGAWEDIKAGKTNKLGMWLTNPAFNFARHISKYARYPVTNVGEEAKGIVDNRTMFYKDSHFAKGCITPLWSNRNYHFKDGVLNMVQPNISIPGGVSTDFFRPAEGTKGEGAGEKGGNRTDGAGQSNDSTSKDSATDKRGKVLKGLEFDNGSSLGNIISVQQFDAIIETFRKVYTSKQELEDKFFGYGAIALELYAYDFLQTAMQDEKPKEDAVQAYVEDLYKTAVEDSLTIEELMDLAMVKSLNYYISLALLDEEELEGKVDDYVEASVTDVKKKTKERASC